MSGGSYNYLCWTDVDQVFEKLEDLERMAGRLAELGYAEDAAAETEEVMLIIRAAQARLQARLDRLGSIWHAVEWWDSGDSSENRVREELITYRTEIDVVPEPQGQGAYLYGLKRDRKTLATGLTLEEAERRALEFAASE